MGCPASEAVTRLSSLVRTVVEAMASVLVEVVLLGKVAIDASGVVPSLVEMTTEFGSLLNDGSSLFALRMSRVILRFTLAYSTRRLRSDRISSANTDLTNTEKSWGL